MLIFVLKTILTNTHVMEARPLEILMGWDRGLNLFKEGNRKLNWNFLRVGGGGGWSHTKHPL